MPFVETMQQEVFEVQTSFRVTNKEFDDKLSNPSTPEYNQLANTVMNKIGGPIAAKYPDTFIGLTNITFRLVKNYDRFWTRDKLIYLC